MKLILICLFIYILFHSEKMVIASNCFIDDGCAMSQKIISCTLNNAQIRIPPCMKNKYPIQANEITLINQNFKILPNNLFPNLIAFEINLSYNQIQQISNDSFIYLFPIMALDLSDNKIVTINSNHFKYLKNLKQLILSNNLIKQIEKQSFKKLAENLLYLDLSNNKIESIYETGINLLKYLQLLDLTNNKIFSIENCGIDLLTSLRSFKLGKNLIKYSN